MSEPILARVRVRYDGDRIAPILLPPDLWSKGLAVGDPVIIVGDNGDVLRGHIIRDDVGPDGCPRVFADFLLDRETVLVTIRRPTGWHRDAT